MMKNTEFFRALLKQAIGNKTAEIFAIESGMSPYAVEDLLENKKIPTGDMLKRIANQTDNDITCQMLYDACERDDSSGTDEDVHDLRQSEKEDPEQIFEKISHDFHGKSISSPEWFLIEVLNELRVQDEYTDERYRCLCDAKYTGDEHRIGNRIYRDIRISLPGPSFTTVVKATGSWLLKSDGSLHDCRFQMKGMEQYPERTTLRRKTDEETIYSVPVAEEGYGFYVDQDHLENAESYCEKHRDLWPEEYAKPDNADSNIWQLVAEIMRSLYGYPFYCYEEQEPHDGIPARSMIMEYRDEIDKNQEKKILKACKETAEELKIPFYGTVWYLEHENRSSLPEYQTDCD